MKTTLLFTLIVAVATDHFHWLTNEIKTLLAAGFFGSLVRVLLRRRPGGSAGWCRCSSG